MSACHEFSSKLHRMISTNRFTLRRNLLFFLKLFILDELYLRNLWTRCLNVNLRTQLNLSFEKILIWYKFVGRRRSRVSLNSRVTAERSKVCNPKRKSIVRKNQEISLLQRKPELKSKKVSSKWILDKFNSSRKVQFWKNFWIPWKPHVEWNLRN